MKRPKISEIEKFVKNKMSGETTGHDFYHVARVHRTAVLLATQHMEAEIYIVEVASLMHDLGDWKVSNSGKSEKEIIENACNDLGFDKKNALQITDIITHMSFSSNVGKKNKLSIEGQIVQDADRLEALGAIGIARAFAYGGKKGREIYDPNVKPKVFVSTKDYKNSVGSTINHFYEKLFLIKDQLNTIEAKKIAIKREKFMKDFLHQFYAEWEGKR